VSQFQILERGGNFNHSVNGPSENIRSVTYLIDGQVMATVNEAPFSLTYETGDYTLGLHELSARVETLDGRTVETAVRRFEFVSSEVEFASVRSIIVPIMVAVLLMMIIGIGSQFLIMRGKNNHLEPGTPRTYGIRGGAICPRCSRPFSRHLWAFNLGPKMYDRCDFCGKWSLVGRASQDELRAAERAELVAAQPNLVEKNKEDDLRRMIDESKYVDKV